MVSRRLDTPPEPAAAPDYAAPVEGWRLWLVVEHAGALRLASIVYDVVWPPGEPLVAECVGLRRSSGPWRQRERPAHTAPEPSCRCGIHAAADVLRFAAYLEGSYPGDGAVARVVGRIALWGTVVEGGRGWRASRAYPARLCVPRLPGRPAAEADAIAEGLAVYRVPVDVVFGSAPAALLRSLVAAEAA